MRDEQRHPESGRSATRWLLGAIALTAAALGSLALARPWVAPVEGNWLLRAMTSPLSVTCGLIMLGCLGLLVVLGKILWLAGVRERGAARGERGAAMLEFVMVMPFALMIILIMIQSMLLMVGNVVVHYSAYCAVRVAIVTIPDDYIPSEPANEMNDGLNSDKYQRIRRAAEWALMPVSSSSPYVGEAEIIELSGGLDTFFSAYGEETPEWAYTMLARKMQYARDYTEVTVDPPERGRGAPYGDKEDIHVTVRHTFYMGVPYANTVFAEVVGGVELPFGAGEYGMMVEADCSLTNEGAQDYLDIEEFPSQDDYEN
jgi:hypothetical protein